MELDIFMISFGIVIIGIITYYVIRFLKGSLKINLEKNYFYFGDEINGTIKLKAKKIIESDRFLVALVEEELRSTGKSSRWVEISRIEKTLEGKRNYPMNFSNSYSFKFLIPEIAKENLNSEFNLNIMNGFFKILKRYRRWRIISRVDATGVDLFSSKVISIKNGKNSSKVMN